MEKLDLERFIKAQERDYNIALANLRRIKKWKIIKY